jgi:hypothetical protein
MADTDSTICPNCKTATTLIQHARKGTHAGDVILYEIGECNNCEQHFLVVRTIPDGIIRDLYPRALPGKVSSALPDSIREDFEEALRCESVGAHRATVTMARRALQGICLNQGAPAKRIIKSKDGKERKIKNDLSRQIDWLLTEQIITKPLKNMAHEVRSVGNNGAHPEDAADNTIITPEDTKEIIALLDAFAQTLYIAPSILQKRIDDRTPENA